MRYKKNCPWCDEPIVWSDKKQDLRFACPACDQPVQIAGGGKIGKVLASRRVKSKTRRQSKEAGVHQAEEEEAAKPGSSSATHAPQHHVTKEKQKSGYLLLIFRSVAMFLCIGFVWVFVLWSSTEDTANEQVLSNAQGLEQGLEAIVEEKSLDQAGDGPAKQADQTLQWIKMSQAKLPAAAPTAVLSAVTTTLPSIVTIVPTGSDERGLGAGFVVQRNDWLVTALRVVAGYEQCRAVSRSPSGKIRCDRHINGFVACDEKLGIVVLSLRERWPDAPLPLSSTGRGSVPGRSVFTAGPVDGLTNYVVAGCILGSGTARSFNLTTIEPTTKIIQTDLTFVPGLLGGPVCDAEGDVLGIASLGFATDEMGGVQSRYQWLHAIAAKEISSILGGSEGVVRPLSELPRYR
tara:strand:+ start:950 stop:2164 length:1215 start_codon:yes stop_codon:yes gene_type:complete